MNPNLHFPPCAACPRTRAQVPGPCPAQTSGHRRYCELAARGDPRHDATLCQPVSAIGMPLVSRVFAFAGAVLDHAAAGFPTIQEAEAAARMEICQACDQFDAALAKCRVCQCNMTLKTRFPLVACPIGKWGPVACD